MPIKRFQLPIPIEDHRAWKAQAAMQGMSLQAFLLRAIAVGAERISLGFDGDEDEAGVAAKIVDGWYPEDRDLP